jgi:hypothetical protein
MAAAGRGSHLAVGSLPEKINKQDPRRMKAMFASLLQQLFLRTNGADAAVAAAQRVGGSCRHDFSDAVEHVVDQLYGRLRMVPNYARVLKEPIATTFRYIDEVAESIPGPLLCSRATFAEDPRVNAFFVNPQHIQEVFSHSEEVRRLFETNPLADDCWALLCMHKQEHTQPGMALVNDQVQRDVMLTSVSFSDHQVVSPGIDEASARCALKCCMFDGLLAHVRRRATEAKTRTQDIESRLNALKARQRRATQQHDPQYQAAELQEQIEALQQQLMAQDLHLGTIGEHLDFVACALSHPAEFLSTDRCSLRLNRQAVKLETGSTEPGYELELSEIHIASHQPRIGALVRFPRGELLPQPDLLKQADLFLAI